MNNDYTLDKWLVIVNPNAGNGKGRKDWARIESLLNRAGLPFNSCFTEKRGHATELSAESVKKGFRKIITVGGDGTLNEVLNGVYIQNACNPSDVCLGIIPVGTGNDWGKMFGIPLVYEGAVDIIKEGKTTEHDVGVVDYFTGNEKQRRYFINIAGLGFEAVVVRKSNHQKEKGKSSKAIYLYNLLSSLISYKNTDVTIYIEDKTFQSKIFSINVGNGRYCGGGMRQTPDALPDDGLLDVTVIGEIGRIEIIKNLKILYDGTILSHPKVDGFRTTSLKVESATPVYIEADGEMLGHTPAGFSVIPAGIRIVYGKKIIS